MNIVTTSDDGIQKALKILHAGGVVMHATETCYGLACDLSNPEALQKLFAIKKRPDAQPVSALFSSVEEAQKYTEWNATALALAKKHLPGPLTIILKKCTNTPTPIFVTPLSLNTYPLPPTVGIRISSHPTAQKLVEAFGSPLSTTSANIHGKENPYSVEEIQGQYRDSDLLPDLLLDEGALPKNASSTIVNLSNDTMEIIRKGNTTLSS